jgi:outer membrane lipoprotein-sorting protein
MKKCFRRATTIIAISLVALVPLIASIAGEEVMREVYHRPNGDDMQATLNMTITNSRGSTRERSIVQFRRDDGETEKKIMFFTAPADVRNTSFLSYSYSDGRKDDQWIYLPALGRVRRIASDKSNESFMGSDFTYDDMGARHPDEDFHTILTEEIVDGWNCYVVESVPKEPHDEYSKTISWVVKDEWIGLKKEFLANDGSVVRTLSIDDYEKIDGVWVITDMTMVNLEKRTSTRIEMDDLSFGNNFRDSFFSERQMKIGPRT